MRSGKPAVLASSPWIQGLQLALTDPCATASVWHPALHAWIVHGSCRIFSGKTSQGCISISIAAHLARMQDDERTRVTEVRELFQRRVDKLRERRVYPADSTCQVAC